MHKGVEGRDRTQAPRAVAEPRVKVAPSPPPGTLLVTTRGLALGGWLQSLRQAN